MIPLYIKAFYKTITELYKDLGPIMSKEEARKRAPVDEDHAKALDLIAKYRTK